MFLSYEGKTKQQKTQQKIFNGKAVVSRYDLPGFLVLHSEASQTFSNVPGHFLWSFRSWVYSLINSFAHLEGIALDRTHCRDKASYNLTAGTRINHAEDSSCPRISKPKELARLKLERTKEILGKSV